MNVPPDSATSSQGWTPSVRQWLTACLDAGTGRGWAVALDFDNTLICGDIGEATLAMLAREGTIELSRLPEPFRLAFRSPTGISFPKESSADLTDYYEALLNPTAHGPLDPTPLATGYAWAVQIMQGLSVGDVARATQKVWNLSRPGLLPGLEVTPGHSAYPVPFFYPEMVDLVAELLTRKFEVRIISASNAWSVRWLVLHALNPLLRERGCPTGLLPSHVLGITTLLRDTQARLYKDSVLLQTDPAYAQMDPAVLDGFRLTSCLNFPVPTYSGKVGALWDLFGRRPYLAAGDSPGDHPMLTFSENRLWIARLEKTNYQIATRQLISPQDAGHWAVQPALSQPIPGFVADPISWPPQLGEIPKAVADSLAIWRVSASLGRNTRIDPPVVSG